MAASIASVAVGDAIPPFVREGSVALWARFAAVNHEIADHHMSDEVARHEGFPAAFAMAPLTLSYVHVMLRAWVGEAGRVAAVSIQLRKPWLRGRVLTATGRVTAVRQVGDEVLVDAEVWADDDEGARLVQGTATVAVAVAG